MLMPLKIPFVIKRYGKSFVLAGLLLSGVFTLFSQTPNPVSEKLVEQVKSLAKNNAPEMIYIQTSKGIYETCEDMWFKTYLLDAQYFRPSLLSKTLYMQLMIESTRKTVWQGKYEIYNGFADGHVYLQDSLPEGNYLLTAFTQHSFLANNEELKAVRRITVKKEVKPQPTAIPNTTQKTDIKRPIQFTTFPEGGNLIDGIQGKLAFKAVGNDGSPVEVEGALLEDSIPIINFKSGHAGMGSLTFTPLAGKKYRIRLLKTAADTVFLLPEVMSQGITLQLSGKDEESLEFSVSQSPSLPKRTVYLRAQVRGVVCCMATASLSKELKIKIPLKEFPYQGIAEFTLFDNDFLPIAERLVYVNPEKKLNIEAQLDKDRYPTRGKVFLKIKVTDDKGQPVVANLGVNVYDKLYRNADDPANILTHCFLSSQLKGKVYDPAFYFDTKNKGREEALDLLLLTQGWRRYVWTEEALQANSGKNQPIIFDDIRGEVHATKLTKQAKGIQQFVRASNPGKNADSYLITSDSTGKFIVVPELLKAWQGEYVYLKPMSPEKFEPRIDIAEPFVCINEIGKSKEINYPLSPFVAKKPDNTINSLVEGRGSIKLAEVTVKAHGIATFRDKYISKLDSIAKFDLCTDYVGECLILNCSACLNGSKPIEGKKYSKWVSKRDPGSHPYVFHAEEMIGVVYHYPKFTEEELLSMNNLSRIKAYDIHREFYEPKYDNNDSLNFPLPDFRNTLLWKPMMITDEKGEASLKFFCSDINTGFIGNIEGVTGEGLLGTSNFEFSVFNPKLYR